MMRDFSPPTWESLRGRSFLVLGLGRSGMAISRALLAAGACVTGFDESGRRPAGLARRGLRLTAHPDRMRPDWVVASPGWADTHTVLRSLRGKGVPVVDELDLASQLVPGPVIAVTGTNGKSTTTALIAAALRASGRRVFCGGNLAPGQPLSAALGRRGLDWYVVEVSSFQLERARWFKPRIAVILNITADHLNRHGTIRHYAECKLRILDRQDPGDFAVLGYDDPLVRAAGMRGRAARFWFSGRRRVHGGYLSKGWLRFGGSRVAPARELRIPGRHNVLNALAAVCAARLAGAETAAVRSALRAFPGLPHRLQLVRTVRGVRYVNNSMCTNPAAGARSLEVYDHRVVLIAGGRNKGLPLGGYVQAIVRHARWAVLIGETQQVLARCLAGREFRAFEQASSLRAAVRAAAARARRGETVLFSPGFASFDMFRDFEDRGRKFISETKRLH